MTHQPKWRALIAYDADALTEVGRARLEAHLITCEICREALVSVQTFGQVAAEIQGSAVPQVDFSAMDKVLEAEAKAAAARARESVVVRGPGRWFLTAGVVTAVAAALMLWLKTEPPTQPEVAQETIVASVTQPEPAREELAGQVIAVAGMVSQDGSAVGLGDSVSVGSQLDIEGAGAVHVRLADGTAFALRSESMASATLRQAFDGDFQVEILAGRSTHQVRTGTHYDVVAGDYTIRVRGTHFEVLHVPDEGIAVTLDEGTVEILRDDVLLETLLAPARWSSSIGRLSGDPDVALGGWVASGQGDVDQLSADAGSDEATLQLPSDANVVRWLVGTLNLPSVEGLATSLRAPVGELGITGFEADGTERTATLMLTEEGAALTEADLSNVHVRRAGYLAPEVISEVVRPSFRNLRRCYERELRNRPELGGQYSLRVSVTPSGAVRHVRVLTHDDLPPPMQTCFVRQAEGWQFPPPQGGAMTFDFPLSLSAAN